MAPPGRRRCPLSPATALLGLVFLFSSTASAASAVLGIDLGTEYIKAALVKPGIPLEIVLTKDSKRKELSAVAFKPSKSGALQSGSYPERFYGSDAVALQARFPGDVYPNLKQLLGVEFAGEGEDVVKVYNERYPAVEVTATEGRKTVSVNSNVFAEGERSFSVEELLAMELKNVKENARVLAGKGVSIDDAVFTVPPFYTVEERRALEVAAKLADLNIMSIVTDGLAVGINYATTRSFPVVNKGEKPETHLVFDMGAGSTSATLLRFQGRQVKDVGRLNKTVQEVHVLGAGWDQTLGGDALNALIFNDMIESFVEVPGAKSASITAQKVKAHGRTAAKLWKDAEKVRQVLSANTQTSSFFESLYEDVDFKYKIDRPRFEELAAKYAARLDGPINRALEAAGLTIEDVDSVIVHGGATRTPFVQSRLESLVGKAKIRANVNSDEAAVFGAAFKAAGLSPSFRVKEIRDRDTQGYNHGIQYSFNMKDRDQKIFGPTSKVGATKDLPFQMMGEFEFTGYQAVPRASGEVNKKPVFHFKSGNLTRAITKMIDDDKCDRESFNNYVQVRLSPSTGTPEITSAWVTCIAEVEEIKGGIVDGIKGFFGGGKKDQEPLKEGESSSASSSSTSSSSKSSGASSSTPAAAEASEGGLKKKEIKSSITYTVTQLGYEKHPRKELKRMQDRLSAFDTSDKSRRTREETLNTLEAFTYRARDYLEDEAFISASTSEIRTQLEEMLSAASDWIYAEGHDAAEAVLKTRLKDLKGLVDPIMKRKGETSGRPEAVKELEAAIADLKSVITIVNDGIKSASAASAASSKSVEELSKSSASATSASASTTSSADAAEDLDDDSFSSSSSSSSEAPLPTEVVNIYTPEDLQTVESTVEKSTAWLQEKKVAQEKLQGHEDAAFSIQEVKAEAKKVNDLVTKMMTRKFNVLNEQQAKKEQLEREAKAKSKAARKAAAKKSKKGKKNTEKGKEEKMPSDEELKEAMEKAGVKGEGIKVEGLRGLKDLKGKDGKPLIQLDLGDDASDEDILEAVRKMGGGKGHDEL